MQTYSLFGLSIYQGSFEEAINSSVNSQGSYNVFLNSHMLYEHNKNSSFQNILEEASFIFPDGMPVLYSTRFFSKDKSSERIAGNDFIFALIQKARKENLKIFWIGGSTETTSHIEQKMKEHNITSEIFSPPYLPIDDFDFGDQIHRINEFDPDIILVGLGCPKQEIWMNRVYRHVHAPMFGLGGAFLLFAGIDTRAPEWMRDLSLEWLYRLALEPQRLLKRYLVTNTYFCGLFITEFWKKVIRRK